MPNTSFDPVYEKAKQGVLTKSFAFIVADIVSQVILKMPYSRHCQMNLASDDVSEDFRRLPSPMHLLVSK